MAWYRVSYSTSFSQSKRFRFSFSETILINRGWISRNRLDRKARPEGQPSGIVELTGIVRKGEARPQFTPKAKGTHFLYRFSSIKLNNFKSLQFRQNVFNFQGSTAYVRFDRSCTILYWCKFGFDCSWWAHWWSDYGYNSRWTFNLCIDLAYVIRIYVMVLVQASLPCKIIWNRISSRCENVNKEI